MTHDELLAKINVNSMVNPKPLLEVVKLHRPDEVDFPDEWESCVECSGNGYVAMYPCETIKVIELNLQ